MFKNLEYISVELQFSPWIQIVCAQEWTHIFSVCKHDFLTLTS